MKWTECAVQDLKKYSDLKASIDNIKERMDALETQFISVNGADTTKIPVDGGGGNYDGFLLDNIVERKRLRLLREANRKIVSTIERGLATLDTKERLVLERFFIHKQKDYINRLMDELHLEQAQIYRIKNQALYKFTTHMYGIEEY